MQKRKNTCLKKALIMVAIVLLFASVIAPATFAINTDFTLRDVVLGESDIPLELPDGVYEVISVNTDNHPIIFGIRLGFLDKILIQGIITADEKGIGFKVPEVDDRYYLVSWDDAQKWCYENGMNQNLYEMWCFISGIEKQSSAFPVDDCF